MKTLIYRPLTGNNLAFWGWLAFLAVLAALGYAASHHMEAEGHVVTGMTNQIVWGTPHVFAVFLIVAASGALNVASIASVFGKTHYKPMARLSGLLAVALLMGGLLVLVLDLGRPDRLIVAMTTYNFKSIFAWNIFLYTGFMAIVVAYLFTMMDRSKAVQATNKPVGFFAFFWRLILTTGTGSIFGFLVARQGYDAAIMAPMFIIMSFAYGLAIFLLVLMGAARFGGRPLGDALLARMKNLLGVFIAAVLYFLLAYHLTNLYATEHHGVEAFILRDGGQFTQMFWIGQILIGSLVPLALLYWPATGRSRTWIGVASVLVILGGLAQMYVTIIGGQAFPLTIFPGYEVSSSFFDGQVAGYSPSIWEVGLGIGGIAIALLLTSAALRVMPFLPQSLADQDTVAAPKGAGEQALQAAA
jgi:Ni/Fe-hydrogenase subunit HybB-like protein